MAYFNANNYELKYRWSGYDQQNNAVTLDIYEKSSEEFTLTYIGGLVSLVLNVQGGQDNITAAVVKTSLDITLVDAPDEVVSGYKYGNWQEFYTPDSTQYLVKLYRAGALAWCGYVTPDSWQESLSYRGAITITARDNLGHLQDFDFDATGDSNGLTSISSIITAAMNKIAFPMDLNVPTTGDAQYLSDKDGRALLAASIYVANFEDRNWYDVLESVLESIGYCLRYCDNAAFACTPVRNLPLCGGTDRAAAHAAALQIEFYGGNRSNDPACREIREQVNYGANDTHKLELFKNLAFDDTQTETTYVGQRYIDADDTTGTAFIGRYWSNIDNDGATGGGWLNTGGYLRTTTMALSSALVAEEGAQALKLAVCMAADKTNNYGIVGANPVYRVLNVMSTDVTVCCAFARPIQLDRSPDTIYPLSNYMAKAYVYLSYVAPDTGTRYYYNGTNWQAAAYLLTASIADNMAESYAFELSAKDISDMASLGGYMDIEFANFRNFGGGPVGYGVYVRLTELNLRLNAKSVLRTDTVTTINNASYNVRIERKPVVGALSANMAYFAAGNYPAALWKYSNGLLTPYAYANFWSGYAASTAIPLPAQIHKQLLCFNHVSLQSLQGYFGAVNKSDIVGFGTEYLYKGQYFLLHSATLDVLANRVTSGTLHEYIWYDDLWDETHNPEYSGTPTYETHSASGGVNGMSAAGGGGHGAAGTVTSVAMTVPTGLSIAGSPITTAGTLALTFASGYSIPTTASQTTWNSAAANATAAYAAAITNRIDNASDITDNNYNLVTANAIYDKFVNSPAWLSLSSRSSNYDKIADNSTGDSYVPTSGAVAKYIGAWTGSSNITNVGTIQSGTWHGNAITNSYLANSSITIADTVVSLGGSISAADIISGLTSLSLSGALTVNGATTLNGATTINNTLQVGNSTNNYNMQLHGELHFNGSSTAYINYTTAYGIRSSEHFLVGTSNLPKNLTVYGAISAVGNITTESNLRADGAVYIGGGTQFINYVSAKSGLHTNVGFYSDTYLDCGSSSSASDARMKKNLKDVALTVKDIADAPAVEFDWVDESKGSGAGSIAQYWEALLPHNVKDYGDHKSMEYGNIALLSAITLARKVEELEARIKTLENELRK